MSIFRTKKKKGPAGRIGRWLESRKGVGSQIEHSQGGSAAVPAAATRRWGDLVKE